ncbi:glycoside hydrolase family 13 protein [Granulicella arctica]|uniref:glycoside hydrolase family 13 protein n=1 Tax=Granulicella arctica TaxID=940613 RepID=UPI00295C2125|nr:alpha-glucosidase [Granulicella arctica]
MGNLMDLNERGVGGTGFARWTMMTRAAVVLALAAMCGSAAQGQMTAATHAGAADGPWWKHAVIYEIYPRSFQDSNGDGVGDLNGITQRMGYLQSLGVDAIWISPMYPSPQVDFGYDISNYVGVDPQYGTLADFDKLVAAGKEHHVRVILDMVLNHTSDKHAWFVESASSRTNPRADWYVWKDPKGFDAQGKPIPPNNWISGFGGSAWEWVPARKQFYYHEFYKQQPDLNWRNPVVEKAAFDAMRFWLDRGVAGFRLDAIPTLFEDPQMRDNPVEKPGLNAQGDPNLSDMYTSNLPEVHDVIRRMRAMADSYPGNRVLIGETYLPNIAELNKWYGGEKQDELQLPMDMQVGFTNKLDVPLLRQRIKDVETQIGKNHPLLVFDNHDNGRSWERYGDGVHNEAIARLIATLLFTSRSTALMYYGEELGMVTSTPTRKEDVQDPIGITGWPKEKGRDGERTPMQWDASVDAGFSTAAKTWLPVAADYKTVNVKVEEGEPNSLLNWHKKLIALRRDNSALRDGSMTMLDESNNSVLSFVRKGPAGSVVTVLNLTGTEQTVSLDVSGSVTTLVTDVPGLMTGVSLKKMVVPAFGSWVGAVK